MCRYDIVKQILYLGVLKRNLALLLTAPLRRNLDLTHSLSLHKLFIGLYN